MIECLRRTIQYLWWNAVRMRKVVGWLGIGFFCLALLLHEKLPATILNVPVRDLATYTWQTGWLPIAHFIDRQFDKFISWPAALIVVGYIMATNRAWMSFITSTASRIKTFDAFGFSLELSEQIRILKRESDDLFQILPTVRGKIAQELRKQVEQMQLNPAFIEMVKSLSMELKKRNPAFDASKCRATIHVESMLFSGELVQLLEYVSGDGIRYPGQKSGRNFSARRGIVGRVWRSEIPEIEGVLPTNSEIATESEDKQLQHIAQIWGLYIEEAKHVINYPSYIAIPLKYNSSKTCVFYMDSTIEEAFPNKDGEIKKLIVDLFKRHRIGSAISDIDRLVGIRGPRIEQLESVSE